MKQAIFSLSLAALGTGFFFHISDCKSKYLTRAEFDEYVASEKTSLCGQGEVVRASGGDVALSAVDVDHADPAVAGGANLHHADRARTDIGDAKPLHGHGDAKRVCASANGDKEADTRPVATQPAEVAHKRVDEMCGRNGRANGDKD